MRTAWKLRAMWRRITAPKKRTSAGERSACTAASRSARPGYTKMRMLSSRVYIELADCLDKGELFVA